GEELIVAGGVAWPAVLDGPPEGGWVRRRHGRDREGPVGVPSGDLPRGPAAPVVADEVETVDPELVGEAQDVAHEPVEAVLPHVAGPGPGRVAPLVGCDGAIPRGAQRPELMAPREGRLREAVQQEDRRAVIR